MNIPDNIHDLDQWERKRALLTNAKVQVKEGLDANRSVSYECKDIENVFSQLHQKIDPWEFLTNKFISCAENRNPELD